MNDAAPLTRRSHRIVVGDGITAAAFVETSDLPNGSILTIISPNVHAFGRGVAYAADDAETPWRYAYLLNSPADDIDPDFAAWITQNWDVIRGKMEGRRPDWIAAAASLLASGDTFGLNIPRAFYGDYMEQRVARVFADLRAKDVTINFVAQTAVSIAEVDGAITITTNSGAEYTADYVDIAPGGPSTQRLQGDDGPFSAPSLFGNEARITEHIKAGAEIFCVGSNATMLDALRLCQSVVAEDKLRFVACSSDGSIPAPLIPRMPRYLTQPKLKSGHKTAQDFLDDVWQAMQTARAAGDQMREIRAGFRAYFIDNPLSTFLPDIDEARLVPRTLFHWFRGGTRDTILDFQRLLDPGVTRTIAGRVSAIETAENGARVLTTDRAGNVSSYDTGFVINCAGSGRNSTFDPLTEQMIADDIIARCPVTGGLAVGEKCATRLSNVRHLSPATTIIGDEVMPMPLYDAHFLRTWAVKSA